MRTGCRVLAMLAIALGCDVDDQPDDAYAPRGGHGSGFTANYVNCDEFAGVGVVPLANVEDLVPDDYTIIEPFPGNAIVVAQAGSCEEISVEGDYEKPGKFAQFGVAVVPPLTPGNGDFYQIFFSTDHNKLAKRLDELGVRAKHVPQLSFEFAAGPTLAVDVPKPNKLAFELDGPITLPDPLAPANPTSVFNYYAQTNYNGNVLQANVVEGIRFGEGSGVVLTAVGEEMEAIVGGEFLVFPFFSNPETFDEAEVSVQTNAF